ncbi:MAG TPA: PP2C family protein-serine/threonine phosphatase [Bacteroidota bacterium]
MSRRAETGTLAGQSGTPIEALQEAFRALSGAGSLKEQSARFRSVVGDYFRGDEVRLLRRTTGEWESMGGGPEGTAGGLPASAAGAVGPSAIEGESVRIVQRLADGSDVGVVLLRGRTGSPYTESDQITLRLFLTVFENAYREMIARRNEKDLIFSLNHRVLQLNSLIDTGIEVSKIAGTALPHHLALERAASLTNASKGVLRVTRGGRTEEEGWFPHGGAPEGGAPQEGGISSAFDFGGETYTFQLFDKESRSGIIPFDETDQLLLDALSRQVHASLENLYLHREALEKQKIEQDIAVAAAIQQRILPKMLPVIEGYDIAGVNIPSKSVGGDYYDCIPLPDGRFAMVIADVAGKGVPAALLVSSFHAYLTAYLEAGMPLVELGRRLNRVISRASTEDKFITAFFALLTPSSGEMETLSAGHNPIFLRHMDGTLQELTVGGIPLGMLDMDFPYQSETLTLGKGERLLLYTDGIPEATDARQRLYEQDFPLKDYVSGHVPPGAERFIQELIADVKKFTGSAPQNDDITALYLLKT